MLCCSSTPDLFCEIFDDNKNEITIDELVRTYYKNPSTRFCFKEEQESIIADTDTDRKNNNIFSKTQVAEEQEKEQESSSVEQTEAFDIPSIKKIKEKEQGTTTINESLYRLGHSDTWGCKNCKLTGDKWFMQVHDCKGAKK